MKNILLAIALLLSISTSAQVTVNHPHIDAIVATMGFTITKSLNNDSMYTIAILPAGTLGMATSGAYTNSEIMANARQVAITRKQLKEVMQAIDALGEDKEESANVKLSFGYVLAHSNVMGMQIFVIGSMDGIHTTITGKQGRKASNNIYHELYPNEN